MPPDFRRVECEIEQSQHESQNQTRGRKNQSGDGQPAAFVKFGMPVDLRQPDEREDQSEDVERTSAAAWSATKCRKSVLPLQRNWFWAFGPPLKSPASAARSPAELAARNVPQIPAARRAVSIPARRARALASARWRGLRQSTAATARRLPDRILCRPLQ